MTDHILISTPPPRMSAFERYARILAAQRAENGARYRNCWGEGTGVLPPPKYDRTSWPRPVFFNTLDLFKQNRYWVDKHGARHEIAAMSLDYVANVIAFIHERERWLRGQMQPRLAEQSDPRWPITRPDEITPEMLADSPLVQALAKRLTDALEGKGANS